MVGWMSIGTFFVCFVANMSVLMYKALRMLALTAIKYYRIIYRKLFGKRIKQEYVRRLKGQQVPVVNVLDQSNDIFFANAL